jgi:PAS domain S-box-containing protein
MASVHDDKILEALRLERNHFVAFAFAVADLLLEVRRDGGVAYVAGAAQELIGAGIAELKGADFFGRLVADDRDAVRQAFDAIAPGGRSEPIDARALGPDGRVRQLRLRAYRLPAGDDNFYVSIARGRAAPARELPVERDPVLGVLERESFSEAVSRRLSDAQAENRALTLTLVDLGGLGAEDGSPTSAAEAQLLAEVTGLLRSHAVDQDGVGHVGAGKLDVVREPDTSFDFVERQIQSLADRLLDGTRQIAVSTSEVGLDAGLTEQESAQAILYTLNRFSEAKPGEFSISSLSEGCRVMLAETLEWAGRIRCTIAERGFEMAFQPIVDLDRRTTEHYEALLRLPVEQGITSYKFVTMAEQLGNIAEFDLAVTEEVIRIIRQETVIREPIAVNVSGRSLVTQGFIDALIGLIRRNADVAHRLLFEVTESAKITDFAGVHRALQMLRRFKARVCLDDFGSGAAAFEYLRSLNVDILKIDGSFVRNINASPFNRAFVRSIASLCDTLGIVTIAEMVEDEATASLVRESGVTHGQGYHFGRPGPIAGFLPAPGRGPAAARAHPRVQWQKLTDRMVGV